MKRITKITTATDKSWLAHLGKVEILDRDNRQYRVTLSDGTRAVAQFFAFERLEVLRGSDGKMQNFDFMPLETTELVRTFITTNEGSR